MPAEKKDAVPPNDIEAEQGVLGSMMIEAAAIDAAASLVKPRDFYRPAHQLIFTAATALHERGEPVDMITLPRALKEVGEFDAVGGTAYLLSLFNTVPTAANVEHYAGIVAEKSALREAHEQFQRLANAALTEGVDPQAILKQAEQQIGRIAERTPVGRTGAPRRRPLAERVRDMADIGPPPTDLPLLWWVLTEKSTHWLAAPSGVGKSTVAFNIVTALAECCPLWGESVKRPCRILYCDLESGEYVLRTKLERLYMGTPRVRGGVFFLEDFDVTTEMSRMVAFCQAQAIDLVVFDTAAKTWSLRDENDNSEIGRAVTPILEALKRAGFASLVIDHTGKNAKGARGASSKSANVDVVLELDLRGQPNAQDATVWFEVHKHKLLGFPPPLVLRRIGNDRFERVEPGHGAEREEPVSKQMQCRQTIMDALAGVDVCLPHGTLLEVARRDGFSKATFERTIKKMCDDGDVKKKGSGYALTDPFAEG